MTTSRAALPASIIAEKFKGKNIAVVHDKTTYGQGLADETRKAMNKGGVKEVLYEGVNTRRQGLLRAGLQDQGRRRRPGLLGRPAHRRRPDRAPDARPGRQGAADRRRRHHRGRVRHHRRPRRRRHADDLLARIRASDPGTRPSSRSSRQEVRAARPTRSTATPRCRSSSRRRSRPSRSTPRRSPSAMHSGKTVQHRDRRPRLRQEGRHHPPDGYLVGGKKKDRYGSIRWKKGPDGKISS